MVQRQLAALSAVIALLLLIVWVATLGLGGLSYAVAMSMLSIATLMGAAGIGFLFGLPETQQQTSTGDAGNASRSLTYRFNTNLQQISDWLTKIIVGVTLVELGKIGPAMDRIAGVVAEACSEPACRPLILPTSAMVTFGVCGFLLGYMWTRLVFPRLLAGSERDVLTSLETLEVSVSSLVTTVAQTAQDVSENRSQVVSVLKGVSEGVGSKTAPAPANYLGMAPPQGGQPPAASLDPNKGMFGGQSDQSGRRLSARVERNAGDPELFDVFLTIESTLVTQPLTGDAVFHLHPTFRNPVVKVEVVEGRAVLHRLSYGAFTVGAETDGGNVRLELDLADLPGVDRIFRER